MKFILHIPPALSNDALLTPSVASGQLVSWSEKKGHVPMQPPSSLKVLTRNHLQ
jgi:hypothetical protein